LSPANFLAEKKSDFRKYHDIFQPCLAMVSGCSWLVLLIKLLVLLIKLHVQLVCQQSLCNNDGLFGTAAKKLH